MTEDTSALALLDEPRKMTYREQQNVKAAILANTALLKAQIEEREKTLLADLDTEIRRLQNEAELEADKVRADLERAVMHYNERIKGICAKYPDLFVSGSWARPAPQRAPSLYRNSDDRQVRVQAAKARVRAQVAAARMAIQQQQTEQMLLLADKNVHSSIGRELLQGLPKLDDIFHGYTPAVLDR